MKVYGEAAVAKFARRHPASRKALQRFLEITKQAAWPSFVAVKRTFAATDYVGGRLIFDVGGNKYRVIAKVDFTDQSLLVESILTHEEYDRESF
jgi:mRNA interferase HigB